MHSRHYRKSGHETLCWYPNFNYFELVTRSHQYILLMLHLAANKCLRHPAKNVCKHLQSTKQVCLKSTMQTLRKMWNMFRVNNKAIRMMTMMTLFWCLWCYLWTYLTSPSSVCIACISLLGSFCFKKYALSCSLAKKILFHPH